MASVLQQYHQLADRMATQITGSYQSWTDFLTTAARLYKYPYHEQLMIYAQRPEATACAEFFLRLVSGIVGILGIFVLVTYSVKNGLILLTIAFLVSPVGIPMIAAHLLAGVQHISSAIKNL